MEQPTSQQKILEAAAEELSERGHDGVRIEHVAKRAGVNKALVYRWFDDRETLFREALRHQFQRREGALDELPDTLSDMLVYWSERTQLDRSFVRLILREALADRGDEPVHGKQRSAYYARQVETLRALARSGTVREDLEPEMLFIALLALIFLPGALPQIVRLVSGHDPSSSEFKERWHRLLSNLAASLAPTP